MTDAELIVELKAKGIGAGLTDAQWAQVATDALRMYSRQRPREVLGTITTAVDVEEYALPAGGHVCLEVAPYEVLGDLDETLGAVTNLVVSASPTGDVKPDFHQPSQMEIYRGKLEHWSRQFGTIWEQSVPGGTVRITPRPTEIKTLAILYSAPHTVMTTVPAGDVDLLVMAGQAVALMSLALGTSVTVISSGGSLALGPYLKDTGGLGTIAVALLKQAETAEGRFLSAAQRPLMTEKG